MAFSPPVVCCLVKKGCQKGGSRAPQNSTLAMLMKTVHFRCPSVAQKRCMLPFFMLATGLKIEQPSVAKTTSTDDFRASESKVKLDAATLGCFLIFVKRVAKGIIISCYSQLKIPQEDKDSHAQVSFDCNAAKLLGTGALTIFLLSLASEV